ncbi:MAG: inovirus-type Gp2 protein [Lentisphaeria bacterium]|nr:inovirus-type Gp2 protein [Lentisphaeria bacterium]
MPRQRIIPFQASPAQSKRLVIEQILTGFVQRLDHLTARHFQVSVCHLTITLPVQSEIAAKIVGQSISLLRRKLKAMEIESQAGWVREVASDKEHFHIGFMWDSYKIQRALKIAIMLNSQLTEALNLTEHHHCVNVNPPNPILDRQFGLNCVSNQTLKIRKGNPGFKEQRANIIGWLSYLAKVETKGNWREKHIREFGFSLCNRKGRLNATQS